MVYNRTITSSSYRATYCDNPFRALTNLCGNNPKVVMGEHVNKDVKGEYFINVNSDRLPMETVRQVRTIFWG